LEVSGVATDTFLTPIVSVTEVTDDSFRKIFAAMSQMTLFAKSSHQRHKCASHLDLVSNRSNGVFEVFVFVLFSSIAMFAATRRASSRVQRSTKLFDKCARHR
jgi:hypothetical protein